MESVTRQIILESFLTVGGEHIAGWRDPSTTFRTKADFRDYLEATLIAERGLLDMMLIAEFTPSMTDGAAALSRTPGFDKLDAMMVGAALAVSTTRIGIVVTASTTYENPFHLARRVAAADHLSNGRAGWNIVTTSNATDAENFSAATHMRHDDRYARAEEFVDVVRGLWDSWRDEDIPRDKESGVYFKPEGLKQLNHKGRHFSVRGPLDTIRTPQGQPVLVQAGSSGPGRALAARVADVVFTTHQTLSVAQDFYADLRERAQSFGRKPDDVSVMLALMPVVGDTEAEARAKFEGFQANIHPSQSLPLLASSLGGIDLSAYALDEPLPADLPHGNGMTSRRVSILDLARRENLTMRQLAQRVAGTRAHSVVIGTAQTIADWMEEWFHARAADGFVLVPPTMPASLTDFVDKVVPELQRRGLFRTAYTGSTLRDHLGRPQSKLG